MLSTAQRMQSSVVRMAWPGEKAANCKDTSTFLGSEVKSVTESVKSWSAWLQTLDGKARQKREDLDFMSRCLWILDDIGNC